MKTIFLTMLTTLFALRLSAAELTPFLTDDIVGTWVLEGGDFTLSIEISPTLTYHQSGQVVMGDTKIDLDETGFITLGKAVFFKHFDGEDGGYLKIPILAATKTTLDIQSWMGAKEKLHLVKQ